MALTNLIPVKPDVTEVKIDSLDDTIYLRKLLVRDKVRLQEMVKPLKDNLSMLHLQGATLAVSLCNDSGEHLYAGNDIDEFFGFFTEDQLSEMYQAFLTVNPIESIDDKKK